MKDRIIDFRRVKASDLTNHELNWRLHPEEQKGALQAMFNDVGFVGAVIARELKDGTLQIIDGHCRKDVAGDEEVPVLITDLNDEETAKILATYDPLSQMAETDANQLTNLMDAFDFDDAFDENAHLRGVLSDIYYKLSKEERRAEAKAEREEEKEIPNMALQPHEHYDYLVIMATTSHDWNVLMERLELKPTRRRKRMGTCRAIRADVLLERLPHDK